MTDPRGRGTPRSCGRRSPGSTSTCRGWPRPRAGRPLSSTTGSSARDCPEPYEQQVIPQPCVTLSAEALGAEPRLLVNGLTREPFVRTLHDRGHVLGATFKPASFSGAAGRGRQRRGRSGRAAGRSGRSCRPGRGD
ncbi:DUF6597 domain-containing transcriptional factor [Aeromicrobium sp. UC242_57]|uniref:DUF6597 domain-containing transcriptional factor n=1 Tax=Aeromicrobium sp. UC242_57 TaxID=3374624 RepID=UPI0037BD4883